MNIIYSMYSDENMNKIQCLLYIYLIFEMKQISLEKSKCCYLFKCMKRNAYCIITNQK